MKFLAVAFSVFGIIACGDGYGSSSKKMHKSYNEVSEGTIEAESVDLESSNIETETTSYQISYKHALTPLLNNSGNIVYRNGMSLFGIAFSYSRDGVRYLQMNFQSESDLGSYLFVKEDFSGIRFPDSQVEGTPIFLKTVDGEEVQVGEFTHDYLSSSICEHRFTSVCSTQLDLESISFHDGEYSFIANNVEATFSIYLNGDDSIREYFVSIK